ncbi:DUF3939 domain-containing protein [Thermoflavimicrobium daqui]|uniref:Lipoprotein n=1 Tax=Thermoflavimicrobium daqui TaxID=2137476 RepID=A0A364K2J2_9BACL|nr:DUF3939 domain-containing protein [Thermoflavimicrobium daqui]RAL22642.1 hypothetical protein DL897_13310 [Thermoflavimicrobium daqui]
MKRWLIGFSIFCTIFLSGCLFPQEERQQLDQLPNHIAQVQSAVDVYKQQKKVLPYRYKDEEIMLTTKYLVDFDILKGYLAEVPKTSFEKGGNYFYILTDVEKKPIVRVMDLRINEEIRMVQPLIHEYQKQKKQLPIKNKIDANYATIDFDKLRIRSVVIQSPYSSQIKLEPVIDQKGRVFIDYRPEAMRLIQKAKEKPDANQDLRIWLAKQSYFVPAYSPPMKFKNNEPIFEVMPE